MECKKSILVKISRLYNEPSFVDQGQSCLPDLKYTTKSVKQIIYHIVMLSAIRLSVTDPALSPWLSPFISNENWP
jgi:hypothetical protein